jgi:hypothetical protein
MPELLSFHGKQVVKDFYVNRVNEHAKADEIVKGYYWKGGKGCAVGCVIYSSRYEDYETELGLPAWLAALQDTLFENLPNGYAKKFAVDFLVAIPVGKNLNKAKWRFVSSGLEQDLQIVRELKIDDKLKKQVLEAVEQCKQVHDRAIETDIWNDLEAKSAEVACDLAGRAAATEALAAGAAVPWTAAVPAEAAAAVAALAATAVSAASAVRPRAVAKATAATVAMTAMAAVPPSASRVAVASAEWTKYADKLLELLRQA